jgi:hypothetical protein
MTSADEFVSVTIPFGRGYEEPKITFHGTLERVATDLCAAFGIDGFEGQTLHEMVSDASNIALALGNVRDGFPGTRSIPDKKKPPTQEDVLIAQISAEDMTVGGLNLMYAEAKSSGKPLEEMPAVWAAWNKRGMELSSK